jgi:alpha-beta hydrolase superfamily lysophospholipase
VALTLIIALVALLVLGLGVIGWVFSNQFLVPAPYGLQPEFEVLASNGATVTLPANGSGQYADTSKEGSYALLWEGGHGLLGPVLERRDGQVVRSLELREGRLPRPGEPARIDIAVFRRDPLQDHGIPFEELTLAGETGQLHAWWIEPGEQAPDTAVLLLHGRRRSDRTETLRILPTIVSQGAGALVLAYRNHDLSDPSPDGLYHYGASERADALTALAALRERGISKVVLYGFSMGGAVALETMKAWPEAGPELLGVILDSPLLDARGVILHGAEKAGLPFAAQLTELALLVGGLRTGVNWNSLDQRSYAAEISVPLLLMSGTADTTVPVAQSDDFARQVTAPGFTYWRPQGVHHVEAWNADRSAYEAWVASFLAAVQGRGGAHH